ncbi:MAG: CRTAC1 family protein [Verrucomicrobia bacterium]|nr:CRTAC1 family protein [Verrucomicrobiota bacterium]
MTTSSAKFLGGILLVLSAGAGWFFLLRSNVEFPGSSESASLSGSAQRATAAKLAQLEAREQRMDETVWAKEILAENCGRTFEALWDSINAASNKLSVVANYSLEQVVLGKWNSATLLPHGIELRESIGIGPVLSANEWRNRIAEFERTGWQLAQIEFRQNRFDADAAGHSQQSRFYFAANLTNSLLTERAMVTGDLIVDWSPAKSDTEPASVKRIDASQLAIKWRHGEPLFEPILVETIPPPENSTYIDPLLLYDLDGDGLSEIILPAKNLVYRRNRAGGYDAGSLCRVSPGKIFTAVIADFDGDGVADLLCAKREGLFLFPGSATGTFDQPPRPVWLASAKLEDAMVLTCGDVDRDGDLDIFLAQYKAPTLGQILRPHFYDALDGFPAYLLLNDGHGELTDATAAAGLDKKRQRRTYSASFVDLNSDRNLDLVVVSDFAGVDVYRNDGTGRFTDVTSKWIPEPHAFGMAHALADFNADGRLDLLMIGMTSPAVQRLEYMKLWRLDSTDDRSMRSRMTSGNRLYLARPEGGFEQTSLSHSIARSGWSWGCGVLDFDNDGYPDVYVANGHQSRATVRDYESEFWLHDIYINDTIDEPTATAYFSHKFDSTLGRNWSYGGYEKNRLFLNQGGTAFTDISSLLGVALEEDSRCVVADDLDGDGRMDLVVTTFELWPSRKQTLRLYRNKLADAGNWIGFRFLNGDAKKSPVGTRVTLHCGGRTMVRQIVTGDSYRSQSANTVHFGLGVASKIETVLINWPHGEETTLVEPEVNQYHTVRPSGITF